MIKPLVVFRYNEAVKLGSEYLFNAPEGQQGIYMTYDKYRGRFQKVMKRHKMNHTPYESRHTFVTIAKSNKMDEYILKMLVGHEIDDIT